MSQLPTGQTGPVSGVRVRRGAVDDVPRIGIQQGFQPAMVSDLPMVQENDRLAESLARSLGVLDRSLAISAQELENQKRQQEMDDEKARRELEGAAANEAVLLAPQFQADLESGDLAPAPGQSNEEFIRAEIARRAGFNDETPAPYREEMVRRLFPSAMSMRLRKQRTQYEQAGEELAKNVIGGAGFNLTPDNIGEFETSLAPHLPDASPETRRSMLLTSGLRVAAQQADTERFNALKGLAQQDPSMGVEILTTENALNEQIRSRQAAVDTALEADVSSLYVKQELGEDGVNFQTIRSAILANKDITPQKREQKLLEVRGREAAAMKAQMELASDQFNAAEAARVRDTDATTALSAFEFGGLARITGDHEWTDPAGQTHKITREQRIESGVNAAFERIDAEGRAPEDAFAQKIDVLANNGARYDPWSNVMEAGSTAVIQSVRVRRENGEKVEALPANAQDGFSLWKQLKATNDRVLAMHVSPRTDDLYSLAALAERQGYPPAQALFLAATTQGRSPYGTVSDEDVAKATDWVDGENAQDMMALVRDTARLSVGSGFADPKAAIKEASKRVRASHRKVGNIWIPTGNRSIHPNFEPASERLLDDWHGLHGEETGIPRGRITLFPSSNGAGWMVYDKRANLPVDTDWFVSDADISAAEERRLASIRDEITNDPFRQVTAAIKNAAAEGAMTQLLGPPGARDMLTKGVGRAADAAGDALARAPIFPTGTTVGELNRDVNVAAGRAKMAGAVALSRGVAGAASWLTQRPGESDQRYTARTGRKSP